MTAVDIFVALILAVGMIFVGYQIYFIPQKWLLNRARTPALEADKYIPFRPKWVWIYSGLYYPYWVSPIFLVSSFKQFFCMCASYIALLFAQMWIACVYPVKTPPEWRSYDRNNSYSEKFLGLVQSIDAGGNNFPSMHVAVAVLTALHILNLAQPSVYPEIFFVWIIPTIIALSTLYTKQHLIVDVPAGAILAFAIYFAYSLLK